MYVLNVYLELFEKSLIFTRGESLPRREKSEKSGVLMLLTKFDRWGGGRANGDKFSSLCLGSFKDMRHTKDYVSIHTMEKPVLEKLVFLSLMLPSCSDYHAIWHRMVTYGPDYEFFLKKICG